MLKTPSVISSLRWAAGSSWRIARAAFTSLWGKTRIVARLSRHPSMMLAWFSSSDTTASLRVRTADTVPALAVNPLWNTTAASVCLKAAMRRSSSSWRASVPGDRPDRAGSDAERPGGLDRLRDEARMGREAQVVVRSQVDDHPAVDRGLGQLRTVEHANRAERALLAEGVEFVGKELQWIVSHGD